MCQFNGLVKDLYGLILELLPHDHDRVVLVQTSRRVFQSAQSNNHFFTLTKFKGTTLRQRLMWILNAESSR